MPRPFRPASPLLPLLSALLGFAAGLPAAPPAPGRPPPLAHQDALERQFAPPRAHRATLARDGRHVAYTVEAGGQTRIEFVETAPPYAKHTVYLGDTRGARIVALHWTSLRRVVIATEDWAIATASLDEDAARIVLDPPRFTLALSGVLDPTDAARDNPLEFATHPRLPRLLGIAPGAVDEVIVEGVAGDGLHNAVATTVRLNLLSGEWREIDRVRLTAPALRLWTDALGRYRLSEDRTRLPTRWQVRRLSADGDPEAWQSLDRVMPDDLARAFAVDAHRLWLDRALPLGFSRTDPRLFYASNVGQDTFGLRSWNPDRPDPAPLRVDLPQHDLATPVADLVQPPVGRLERAHRRDHAAVYYTDFRPEPPADSLVFDRATDALVAVRVASLPAGVHWLDPTLDELQATLERDHPDRRVEVLDWDDARSLFLVKVSSPATAGRYFVYRTADAAWVELLRRDALDRTADFHRVETFTLTTPDLPPLHGRVTRPRQPLGQPPPLVCLLPDGPWQSPADGRSAPAHLLAEFGCLVLEIRPRGFAGHGNTALLDGRDQPHESARADLARALAWLEGKHPYDPRKVALVGVGYGGWLALRLAALSPGTFRSVAALDAFDDLGHLFAPRPERERPDGTASGLQLARDMTDYMDATRRDLDRLLAVTSGGNLISSGDDSQPAPPPTRFSDDDPAAGGDDPFSAGAQWDRQDFNSRQRVMDRLLRRQEETPVSLPAEFARWFFGRDARQDEAFSVPAHAGEIDAAVLLCASPDRDNRRVAATRSIAAALAAARNPPEVAELPPATWSRSIAERPDAWLRVVEFLNDTLIHYDVQIGPVRAVPEAP